MLEREPELSELTFTKVLTAKRVILRSMGHGSSKIFSMGHGSFFTGTSICMKNSHTRMIVTSIENSTRCC